MATTFKVEARQKSGTGPARAVRRADMVPGILYGNKQDPEMFSMSSKDILLSFTSKKFFSTVFALDFGNKTVESLVKAVQKHPVTDRVLHIDFLRINKDSLVTVNIPVHYINENRAPAIKRGGVLNIVIHELAVVCSPYNIPDFITVDLAGIETNTSIVLDSIHLPENVVAADPKRDNVLATVVAPSEDEE
ncbi:MAG: 50S ribosomal protein L25/general stress protein Ctc [Alphaproteobacteria bacterium]|nr:50S ribosomal protein L25/general stress protein Ctc [Alphaproteobacteria bacterium]